MQSKAKSTILFISNHEMGRAPSQRFRYEQYIEYLEQNGFECDFAPLLNKEQEKILYGKSNLVGIVKKIFLFLIIFLKRLLITLKINKYNIIFIHREAFIIGRPIFEQLWFLLKKNNQPKFIYDFDDAIWLVNVSKNNSKLSFLKSKDKPLIISKLSDLTLAGNEYLSQKVIDYQSTNKAKKNNFNKVEIFPTTVDTEIYKLTREHNFIPGGNGLSGTNPVIIGWSGSHTTVAHFESHIHIWRLIKNEFGEQIKFILIGDENYSNNELGIRGIKWNIENELNTIASFDIGIMPLPNDEWSTGKCGLKGLTYMAFEKPTIMSNVGVNSSIIGNNEYGYLASYDYEWLNYLKMLIQNPELRIEIGKKGRKRVVENYSVSALRNTYLQFFKSLSN